MIAGRCGSALDFAFPAGQPVEEVADPLLHPGHVPQVQVPIGCHPHPAADRLIGVEVWAVNGGDKLDHWGAVMVYHLVLSVIGEVHANGSRKGSRLATAEAVQSRTKPEVTGVG